MIVAVFVTLILNITSENFIPQYIVITTVAINNSGRLLDVTILMPSCLWISVFYGIQRERGSDRQSERERGRDRERETERERKREKKRSQINISWERWRPKKGCRETGKINDYW